MLLPVRSKCFNRMHLSKSLLSTSWLSLIKANIPKGARKAKKMVSPVVLICAPILPSRPDCYADKLVRIKQLLSLALRTSSFDQSALAICKSVEWLQVLPKFSLLIGSFAMQWLQSLKICWQLGQQRMGSQAAQVWQTQLRNLGSL